MIYKIYDPNDSLFDNYPEYEAKNARDAINQHLKAKKYTFKVKRSGCQKVMFKAFAYGKKDVWFAIKPNN